MLLALLEQIAYPGSAYSYKHFDKVRSADTEKRNARFAGDGLGEQGLARARRSDDQHTLGDPTAQLLKFMRVLKEFDDFDYFLLGLINPRHV